MAYADRYRYSRDTPSGGRAPEDYQLSRAALRDRYGSRRIDASAPHAANDSMVNLTGISDVSGGDTTSHAAQFNAFFHPSVPATPAPPATAVYSGGSSLFDPQKPFVPTMTPTTPTDPASMAATAGQAGLLSHQPVIDAHKQWFTDRGMSVPTKYGDEPPSKFGRGVVTGGSVTTLPPWAQKLSKLATIQTPDEWQM